VPRTPLGLIAAALLIGGLVFTFSTDPGPDELAWGGILLRSGALLGAVWLVLPNARRLPRAAWVAIGTVLVVLAIRPRLILWGLVLAVVAAAVTGIGRSRTSKPER